MWLVMYVWSRAKFCVWMGRPLSPYRCMVLVLKEFVVELLLVASSHYSYIVNVLILENHKNVEIW
jgi:hypothetical protein